MRDSGPLKPEPAAGTSPATEPRPLRLSLRIAEAPATIDREPVCSSTEAAGRIRATIGRADRECFVILHIDPKNQLLAAELHSIGDVDAAAIYPRQVMKSALLHNASALIFGHNHPSGDPEPSLCDREITRALVLAARVLGIKVLDHVIIGPRSESFSFADQGLIDDYDQAAAGLGVNEAARPYGPKAMSGKSAARILDDLADEIEEGSRSGWDFGKKEAARVEALTLAAEVLRAPKAAAVREDRGPYAAGLPARAYLVHPTDPALIVMVIPGERGYFPIVAARSSDPQAVADDLNGGPLAPEVAEAMLAGSMFGWRVPGADPATYEPGTNRPRPRTRAKYEAAAWARRAIREDGRPTPEASTPSTPPGRPYGKGCRGPRPSAIA